MPTDLESILQKMLGLISGFSVTRSIVGADELGPRTNMDRPALDKEGAELL